jgi:hypothetical protein
MEQDHRGGHSVSYDLYRFRAGRMRRLNASILRKPLRSISAGRASLRVKRSTRREGAGGRNNAERLKI